MTTMTKEEVREFHISVLESVFAEEYFTSKMKDTLFNYDLDLDAAYKIESVELIYSFWNDFWNRLPDDSSIHRTPFYMVCDLAEGDYLIGLEIDR
jgi:hypothetical protein